MTDESQYSWEVWPSDGGGWLMAVVDQDGAEIAGGTFPPGNNGYHEAIEEAETIIESIGGEL